MEKYEGKIDFKLLWDSKEKQEIKFESIFFNETGEVLSTKLG